MIEWIKKNVKIEQIGAQVKVRDFKPIKIKYKPKGGR